ncbi:MAG: type II toxin-antitoxin system RelE/ParE family toxin [Methylococcaceae bacterium]
MSYDLQFHPAALKEWRSLDTPIREQFKNKLIERLQNPHHKPSQLSDQKNRYKKNFALWVIV